MKKYLSAAIMLIVLCGLAVTGRAKIAEKEDIPGIPSVPAQEYEALSASLIDTDPSHYTLDTRKFSNIGLNEQAEYYAIYTSPSMPTKCADFRAIDPPSWMISKYKRVFDIRGHEDISHGMKAYGCVVLPNMEGKPKPEATPQS